MLRNSIYNFVVDPGDRFEFFIILGSLVLITTLGVIQDFPLIRHMGERGGHRQHVRPQEHRHSHSDNGGHQGQHQTQKITQRHDLVLGRGAVMMLLDYT